MSNNKSIQILRSSPTYDISLVELLDGQPFYHKGNKLLYVGDNTQELLKPVGAANLVPGEGLDSVILIYSGPIIPNLSFANTNTGASSVVFGYSNTNNGAGVILSGGLNTITEAGQGSVQTGAMNNNSGEGSIQAGANNRNSGPGTLQSGGTNVNSGESVILSGIRNENTALFVMQGGSDNANSGASSILGGARNTNSGYAVLQIGADNKNNKAHLCLQAGLKNTNNGGQTIQVGYSNTNHGWASAQFGSSNINYGKYSMMCGLALRNEKTNSEGNYIEKQVFGHYNHDRNDTIFEIGNGSYDSSTKVEVRSNAFMVMKDGRAKVQTKPSESNDVVRKLELDKKIVVVDATTMIAQQLTDLFLNLSKQFANGEIVIIGTIMGHSVIVNDVRYNEAENSARWVVSIGTFDGFVAFGGKGFGTFTAFLQYPAADGLLQFSSKQSYEFSGDNINTKIEEIEESIATEASLRAEADTTLQSLITNETNDRESEDERLEGLIAAETAARESAIEKMNCDDTIDGYQLITNLKLEDGQISYTVSDTDIGEVGQPIYLSNGKITACNFKVV